MCLRYINLQIGEKLKQEYRSTQTARRGDTAIETRLGVHDASRHAILSFICLAGSHIKRPHSPFFNTNDGTIQQILKTRHPIFNIPFFNDDPNFKKLQQDIHKNEKGLPPVPITPANDIIGVVRNEVMPVVRRVDAVAKLVQDDVLPILQKLCNQTTALQHCTHDALPTDDRTMITEEYEASHIRHTHTQQLFQQANQTNSHNRDMANSQNAEPSRISTSATSLRTHQRAQKVTYRYISNHETLSSFYKEFRVGINGTKSILILRSSSDYVWGKEWSYRCPIYGEIDILLPLNATDEQEIKVIRLLETLRRSLLTILHNNGKKKTNVRQAWRAFGDLIRLFHRTQNINIKGYIRESPNKEKKGISEDKKNLLGWYLENRKKFCAEDSLSANRMESWPGKWKANMKGNYN